MGRSERSERKSTAGRNASRRADRTSPLRRITSVEQRPIMGIIEPDKVVGWRDVEVLECGHEQGIKKDIYGETNALRRRCKQCAKEQDEARE